MVYADAEFRNKSGSPWLLLGVLLLADFVPVDTFAHLFIHSYKCGASGIGRYKGDHVSKYLVHSSPHTGTSSAVTLGYLTWAGMYRRGSI